MSQDKAWWQHESPVKPRTWDILIGKAHEFTFRIPFGARNTLPPAKKTQVADIQLFKNYGIKGIEGLGAKVKSVTIGQKPKDGMCDMKVLITEPLAYTEEDE